MKSKSNSSSDAATPGDYLLYADSYWSAAKRLFNAQPLPDASSPGLEAHHLLPGLTLVCICIELAFKAFLVLHKFDEAKLKDVGHDLKDGLSKARDLGFFGNFKNFSTANIDADIDYLDGIYRTTSLKYPQEQRPFVGKPDYLELAKFLVCMSASRCSVTGLQSQTEQAFDGPQFGSFTNTSISGAGRYVSPSKSQGNSK